jgi:hypothetical protein
VNLVALTVFALVSSATPVEALALAGWLHHAGEYEAAAAIYDALQAQGHGDGRFSLNHGNAHFLAGNLPEAILAYRRAERLIPNDARLRANLAEARRAVVDAPTGREATSSSWAPQLSRPFQVRLAFGCYLAAWIALGFSLLQSARWPYLGGLALLLVAIGLGLAVYGVEARDRERPVVIVTGDGVALRRGNGVSYPLVEVNGVAVKLNRGVEGRVRATRPNGWVQLALDNGLVGWVPGDLVLVDRER